MERSGKGRADGFEDAPTEGHARRLAAPVSAEGQVELDLPRSSGEAGLRRPDPPEGQFDRSILRVRGRQGGLAARCASQSAHDDDVQGRRHRRHVADPADQLRRDRPRREELPRDPDGRRRDHRLVHAAGQQARDRWLALWRADERRLPSLHPDDQRRAAARLRQGWPDRPHQHHRVHRRGCMRLDHDGAGTQLLAAEKGPRRAPRLVDEGQRLFGKAPAPSDEAGRLRPERGAQSAEPGQVRLCPHQLGRGPRHRLE